MLVLYTDGGCSNNSQKDVAERRMTAVVSDEHGKILIEKKQMGGSNNVAELLAVKEALLWCVANKIDEVEIRTDSKNNFAWMFGWRLGKHLNDRAAVEILRSAISAARHEVKLEMTWVPREESLAGHYIERKYAL